MDEPGRADRGCRCGQDARLPTDAVQPDGAAGEPARARLPERSPCRRNSATHRSGASEDDSGRTTHPGAAVGPFLPKCRRRVGSGRLRVPGEVARAALADGSEALGSFYALVTDSPHAGNTRRIMCRDRSLESISGARRKDAHTGKISLDTFCPPHTVSNGRRGHGGPS